MQCHEKNWRRAAWTVIVSLLVGCALLNPASASAASALPILVYHEIRIGDAEPPDSDTAISQAGFTAHMQYLHEQGFTTLGMDEVVRYMKEGKSPAKKIVAIHFDDGWESVQHAIPVLDRLGFKASFGIIAGTGIGWPHMTWDAIEAIRRNPRFDIFSHTMTHPWKDKQTMIDWMGQKPGQPGIGQVHWELTESRRILEQRLGQPVHHLAWPRGLYNDALIGLAQEAGYRALLTIDDGVNHFGDDVLRIRRTMVHGACSALDLKMIVADGRYRNCAKPR